MKWFTAMLLGSLTLAAHASPPDAGTPKSTRKKSAPKQAPARSNRLPLTLETLDRYIQYRREADTATQRENEALLQKAEQGGDVTYAQLQQMMVQEEALRAKHGLNSDDFEAFDQMVRNISEARFKSESVSAKAALKNLEAQANGPPGPEREMARGMLAQWQKDLQGDPDLHRERKAYGDAAVNLVLQREEPLKELWIARDAAAAKAAEARQPPPPLPMPSKPPRKR